jgi:hypothetical protein
MEKMKYNLIFMALTLFLLSCGTRKKDSITVCYLHGMVETPIRITCESMKESAKQEAYDDTITISANDFEKIKESLKNHKIKKSPYSCDARIIVTTDSFSVCMGDIRCACDLNDNNISIGEEASYLIKWKSGYYNYFEDKNDLMYDEGIKIYGIPKDYKFVGYSRLTPIKQFHKVLILEDK